MGTTAEPKGHATNILQNPTKSPKATKLLEPQTLTLILATCTLEPQAPKTENLNPRVQAFAGYLEIYVLGLRV